MTIELNQTYLTNKEGFLCGIIIGVGGCGCAIINRMIAADYARATYIAVDSDIHTLDGCKAEQKIHLPKAFLHETPAVHELTDLLTVIPDADVVFVIVGMGGATGTAFSPCIAQYAKQHGALTIGVAVLPLASEGSTRNAAAEKGLEAFQQHANSVVVVPLDALLPDVAPVLCDEDTYQNADNALATGIVGMTDAAIREGLIGLDFADYNLLLGNGGITRICYSTATGKNRALQAAEQAISCPTLGGSDTLKNASGAIIIINGDSTVDFDEIADVIDIVTRHCAKNTNIIMQFYRDGKEGELSLVIIASEGGMILRRHCI